MYLFFLMEGGKNNIKHFNYTGHLLILFIFPFEGHRMMWMSHSTGNCREVPILTAVGKAYTNVSWKSD